MRFSVILFLFLSILVSGAHAQNAVDDVEAMEQPGTTVPEFDSRPFRAMPVAVLQALDKVTARVSEVTIARGQVVTIGSLKVTLKACMKTPPEEQPEIAAFVDVREELPGQMPRNVFQGWMFASSPGLSAIEHPVYDVWVVDCRNELKASG